MHEILARPAKILTQAQRQDYFEQGFIGVQKLVDATWLERLQGVTSEFIERSRDLEAVILKRPIPPTTRVFGVLTAL